jgi:VWFA-related protein
VKEVAVTKPVFLGLAMMLAYGRASGLGASEPPTRLEVGESIDVRVVNVEAVVTDRRGHPVRGLAAADFQLLVDGSEVPIDYFTEVRDGQAAAVAGAAAEKGAATPPAAGAPAAAAPTPQVSPGATVGRSYLVFIDDGFAVAARRNAALKRLREELPRLGPGDQMAVIVFDGANLEVLSGWSGDPAALSAALVRAEAQRPHGNRLLAQHRSIKADEESVKGSDLEPDVKEAALAAMAGRVSPEAVTQLNHSAAAAAAALRGFEQPAGRRVMLLLSAGWSIPAGRRFYGPLLDAANQLGYTLYPVDVATGEIEAVQLFDGLVRSTGGHALNGGGSPVLTHIAEETGSYYWLGFAPAWKADNRRHAIAVRVRQPGLEVRSRQSFSDLSRRATLVMKAESVLFFGASSLAPGPGEPRLRVEAGQPRASGRSEVEFPVTLLLPVSALAITAEGSGFVAEVPLLVAALDKQGGRAELPGSVLHFRFAALPAAKAVARFRTSLKLRRIDQRLVFAVPDAQSGAVLTTDIEVHPPS